MNIRLLLIVFLVSSIAVAQDFSEDWTAHFSYNQTVGITSGNDKVYVASENAVFIYNTLDGTTTNRTTVNGLSGNLISSIYYSESFDTLFVGYENGVIDVIVGNTSDVLTVVDIFNKPAIPPDRKRINHFEEYNGFVYIATGFGVSLYDVERLEFDDSYFIGNNGGLLDIGSTAVQEPYIYAATLDGGLRRALVANDNLIDFNNWETTRNGAFEKIIEFDNNLYLQEDNGLLVSSDGLDFSVFQNFPTSIIDVRSSAENIIVTLNASVFLYDVNGTQVQNYGAIEDFNPKYATALVEDSAVYIGTLGSGVALFDITTPGDITRLLPNGPLENAHFDVAASAGSVWSVFGDYTVSYNPFPLKTQGISRYTEADGWNFIPQEDFFGASNFVHIAINDQDPSRLYASSFNGGLVEIIDETPSILYDENNSPLLPVATTTNDVRVNGGAFDNDGNFWVTNARSVLGLQRVSPSGQFTPFNTEEILAGEDANLDAVAITPDGNIFVGTDRRGVIAFNPGTNTFARLAGEDGAGNLPIDDIRSLAVDRNGALWIGTRLGLRVLFSPSQLFENPQVSANAIIILQDGIAQELLNDQVVTDIIVDGANNKWLATADSGVFYVSPNGQETIFHFTTDNSPLPSNTVQSVAIDPETGSVYFGTIRGMVAFDGSSTAPAEDLEEVLVYPNPVRPGFNGNVRIEGLTANTNVKITDLVGNLVYEENTTGGSIEWDTTAFGRHKVASGVYLIIITGPPEELQETTIEKVMIIR
ncbi:two-component regulator propeller domain-containing protein [uncultured Dokdonia sp.]|uniref:type IX secretion system anionic LPS delivery protein PorZ n=1 Tax=uncultured Dokdonia sp. TaxID=575653 RepID=UPI0030EC0C42